MTARLEWRAALGAVFAIAALALYFSSMRPAQMQLEHLQAQGGEHPHLLKAGMPGPGVAQFGLDAFYAYFPASRDAPEQLRRVFAAAAGQGLHLAQAEYAYAHEPGARLASYRIQLPMQGSDAQIRRFALQVLKDVPAMSLDEISFSRDEIGSEMVDGKIRFTLYLRAE